MRNGREEKYNHQYGLAYGRDHIVGLFVQVWKLNPKFSPRAFENQPDDSNIIVDKDQFSGTLTVEEIVKIAIDYGFDLSAEISPDDTTISYD